MGGTFVRLEIGLSIDRSENLPADMDADDVTAEVCDVVRKALDAWYVERGHQLLRTEPIL